MRKSLLALAFTAALPTVAFAGAAPSECPFEQKPHAEIPHNLKALDLTSEQRAAVTKAVEEQHDAKKDILNRYLEKLPAEDKAALKKELQANTTEHDKAIRQVLTPEQLKKFEEHQTKAKAAHAEWDEFQKWKAEKEKAATAAPAPASKPATPTPTPAAAPAAEKAPEKK